MHTPDTLTRPGPPPSPTLSGGAGEGRNATAGLIPLPHRGRGGTARASERWVRVATPFLLPAVKRRADRGGARLDDRLGLVRLRPDDRQHARFQDAGFFAGDRRDRVAEKGL